MFNTTEIAKDIRQFQKKGLRLFLTSSFQSHSIPLLHIISQVDPSIPVYFLNTGYHFSETLAFKDQISKMLGLSTIDVQSATPKSLQRDANGMLFYATNVNYCCYLNKVLPLEPVLEQHDVWINGVRADQNANRKAFQKIEQTPNGKLRYHPILNWTSKMIYSYQKAYDLPTHPLEAKGYFSVGCEPCTQSILEMNDERVGRWKGMKKSECGLHTDLIEKKEG